jgi:hypothetical protein
VFDDPAQALCGGTCGGVPESGGVALDVMGGAKQLFARKLGKTVSENCGVCGREPVGLDSHPVIEFAGQTRKRFFGARNRVVEMLFGDAPQHVLQRIRLRDHVMVGECLDLERSRACLSP